MSSEDPDRPDLLRLWLEFDVGDHEPEPLPLGQIRLDDGDLVWRFFSGGVGVTGYDEADCLQLIADAYQLPVPPITVRVPNVRIAILEARPQPAASAVRARSVMVWRGVWYPSPNGDRVPARLS